MDIIVDHLVKIEEQEALVDRLVMIEDQGAAVDNIVMVIGFAQNVAIRILHGEKNVIVVMPQSQMMEEMEAAVVVDQEDLVAVLEVQIEVMIEAVEISLEEACEAEKGQAVDLVVVLIVNDHINFQNLI